MMDRMSAPLNDGLRTRLLAQARSRQVGGLLSRAQALFRLRQAAKAAGRGAPAQVAVLLAEVTATHEIHGFHAQGADLHFRVQSWSGRWGEAFLADGRTPAQEVHDRLTALVAEAEADPLCDRSPEAILAEAIDRFGLEAVEALAEVDTAEHDRLRRLHAAAELPPPAKTLRTLCAAARRMLERDAAEVASVTAA